MNEVIYPVILCGGSGTRLWPLSRKSYPKQFVKLMGEESLFQSTARRLSGSNFASPSIVTASDFRFTVLEQLASIEILPENILIEPVARNTAAAIAAAAIALEAKNGNSLLLIAPSDHIIRDAKAFCATVQAGIPKAQEGQIVTFGIRPNRAETGYGWLELANTPSDDYAPVPQKLIAFIEKPDEAKAEALLKGGMHLWNAGIFLTTTQTILSAIKRYAPAIYDEVCIAYDNATADLSFTRLALEPWSRLPNISIDYAVMERSSNLSVVPYGGSWSDMGDWQAIWRESGPDHCGVVTTGPSTSLNCKNSLLHAARTQQLVAIGVENIVVAMPDAVLIANKDCAQNVKEVVSVLKSNGVVQADTCSEIIAHGVGMKALHLVLASKLSVLW